jgi:hypothetical protein
MDRRPPFFFGAAVVCLLLMLVAKGHAWVAGTLGAVYLVLAAASWLDARSRHHR